MLKRLVILAGMLALAAMPAAGCAQISGAVGKVVPAVATQATKATTLDEKALIAVELAYNVPAEAYVAAYKAGVLTPEAKALAKPKLQMAKKALDIARTAYRLGDAASFGAQLAEAKRLIGEVRGLLPPGPS